MQMEREGQKERFPPAPDTEILGYRAQNHQSRTNLLRKNTFFPQNCNAYPTNPTSTLLCDHGSRVTYNIHSKFEHTAKAAVKT